MYIHHQECLLKIFRPTSQLIILNLVALRPIIVGRHIIRSSNFFHWSQEDKKELTDRGLDWGLVEDMQKRCGALREAQSRWITTRFSHEEAERLWTEKSPLA
ncbi:MAG: hypothetical protein SVZ03_09505 [Spirochaetota bacterium]|nr:hypothetical protein [Spirochaetota bacterium]